MKTQISFGISNHASEVPDDWAATGDIGRAYLGGDHLMIAVFEIKETFGIETASASKAPSVGGLFHKLRIARCGLKAAFYF